MTFSLFPLRPGQEPLPLNRNALFPLASFAGSFTLRLCELTRSRYSVENQRPLVLGGWLVSLSTTSMVSGHLRACTCHAFRSCGLVLFCGVYVSRGRVHFIASDVYVASTSHLLVWNVAANSRCFLRSVLHSCSGRLEAGLRITRDSFPHFLGHLYPGLGSHFATLDSLGVQMETACITLQMMMPCGTARPAATATKSLMSTVPAHMPVP